MNKASVIANGRPTPVQLPCTLEQFLVTQGLLPRSVVVEHNGEAVVLAQPNPALAAAGLAI
jgi:sulfur carrier protein ThiS